MTVIFGTHVKNDDISNNVSQFFKFVFLEGFRGVKGQKNVQKLPISVCHALYPRKCRSYHRDF